jgi:ComEC/Rec2-related protein
MIWFTYFPKRIRLITALTGFLVGITIGSVVGVDDKNYGISAFLLCCGLFLLIRSYGLGLMCLSLGCALLGYVYASAALTHVSLSAPYAYQGQALVVSVRSSKPPQERILLKLLEGPKKGTQVRFYDYDWLYTPGMVLNLEGEITPSEHQQDRGLSILGTAKKITVTSKVRDPSRIWQFRALTQDRVGASLPEPYASLAIGLVTGAYDEFDPSFKEDLQRTGTTHIVAVSGYNLTIVALLLLRWGRRKSRLFGFALAVSSLLLYLILAGTGPSILRGASVAFLSLLALVTGRITHRLPLLLLSATILSLITPLGMLYNLSWQLSFLAFSGILFLNPLITPVFTQWFGSFGASLGETLSAEAMVLPVVLVKLGVLSIVSPLVNAVILGLTPLAMGLSFTQAVLSLIWLEAGRLFSWISYPILWLMIEPIQWSSQLPFAAYTISHFSWVYFAISYGLVGLLFGGLVYKQRQAHETT